MKKFILTAAAVIMLSTPAMASHVKINDDRKAQLIELVREAEHFCYGIQITKLDYSEEVDKELDRMKPLRDVLSKEGFLEELERRMDFMFDNNRKDNREFSKWCYQMLLDKVVANKLIKAFDN